MSKITTSGVNREDAWATTKLKAFYFLFYGSVGIYALFFAPYMRGLGFSGADIAVVTVAGPFVGIAAVLGWGMLADRLGDTTRTLRWCTVTAFLPWLFLPFVHTPVGVACINLLQNASAPACVPLIDSLTYERIRTRRAENYTRIRLYGALGGLATVQVLGLLLTARGGRPADPAFPLALITIMAALAILARFLPEAPPRDRPPNVQDVKRLSRDRSLQFFLFICLLHWICYAPYDLLFGVFLSDRGLPSSFFATALVGGSVAEATILFVFPALAKRFTVRPLLGASFIIMGMRWWLLAESNGPVAIASVQLLHGAASGLFWGTMVQAIGYIVPARLRVTGHAVFAAVVVGGGGTVGYLLAGIGYDNFGGVGKLFQIVAALEVVPLTLVFFAGRRFDARNISTTEQKEA